MAEEFDLIIIGSGSGNAIPDYLSDRRIALVERDPQFGGTCLNKGCIPSKMFVLPADRVVEAGEAARLGVTTTVENVDWAAIRDRVFARIDPISAGGMRYRQSGTPNLTLVEGTARFVGPKSIDVGGRALSAPKILIAAGARPHVPPIDGLAHAGFETSDTIMRLDALPRRLGIIGAGFIAAEMGHVFAAYGSEVTVLCRGDRMLRHHDAQVAERFTETFARRANLITNATPTQVNRSEHDGVSVWHVDYNGGSIEVDALLIATGRVPNVDLLDLDAAGIAVNGHGVIAVDAQMRTNVDGIWAIGDIANTWQLKHVANAEAAVAFWNIAQHDDPDPQPRTVDYSAVPSAVFSHPQVATVGLTEQAARDAGRPIAVGVRDYSSTAYGWALEDDTSFAKVIIDAETNMILGAHIMGPQAATLIQPLIQAIQFGQSADQIARGQFWIHPALTEVVENALIAATSSPDAVR